MSQIAIAYSSGLGSYNFVVDNFGGTDMPRTYQESAAYSQSSNGASILAGPAFRQKYQWVISTLTTPDSASLLMQMFEAWDEDRSNGLAAAVGLTDTTGPGSNISANAIFATAPSFTRVSPSITQVSFGLMEV